MVQFRRKNYKKASAKWHLLYYIPTYIEKVRNYSANVSHQVVLCWINEQIIVSLIFDLGLDFDTSLSCNCHYLSPDEEKWMMIFWAQTQWGQNLFWKSHLYIKKIFVDVVSCIHSHTKRLHILKINFKETVERQKRQDKTKHASSEVSSNPFIHLHDPLFLRNMFFLFSLLCIVS